MMRHRYGPICEACGARLDPGERCDCAGTRGKGKAKRSRPAAGTPRSERKKSAARQAR